MKKNRPKEEIFLFETDDLKRNKSSSENILIFLFLAVFLLSLNLFTGYRNYLQQNFQPPTYQDHPKKFVWLTGSADPVEGLYQFTPEKLQLHYPEISFLLSEKTEQDINPLVTAINLRSGIAQTTVLPPEVAHIFFQPIPLNRADKNILTTLPGIGPSLAEKIIQRRKQYGPFDSKAELMQIKGIGPKKLAALAEQITID